MNPHELPWWRRLWLWLRTAFRRRRLEVREAREELVQEVREELREAREELAAEAVEAREEIAQAGERIREKLLDLVDDLPFVSRLLTIRPVHNQVYGHGAFMGAAPGLLTDARWRRILSVLMPDVFEDVRAAIADGAGAPRLIPMFENNPVMCAYGAWLGCRRRRDGGFTPHPNDLFGVEWDAYLDGGLVEAWQEADAEGRRALRKRIVDTTVIAHASTTDVVQEAAGLDQYGDVRTTPKTRMGGVPIPAWLDLFGRALDLADAPDLDAALAGMRGEERVLEGDACDLYTFASPRPASAAVEAWRRVTGQPHFAVVLELKSLRSTPELVGDMIAELNERGVVVRAVCSFKLEEVAGIPIESQRVGADTLPPPRPILFFHFAADLQVACDAGGLPPGLGVLFNGASLLDHQGGEAPYRVLTTVVEELEDYRARHALDIGLYVQEYDCDAAAAALLSELVESHTRTFHLGFAWGGIVDEACIEVDGDDHRGMGSQAMLAWVKRGWRLRADEDTAG